MSRRRTLRSHWPVGAWRAFAEPPADDVGASLLLLAELTADHVETGYRGGEFYVGGRYDPSPDQHSRAARLAPTIARLVPLLAPVEWPTTRGVSLDLTYALRRLPVRLDRPTYVTHRQAYPQGWIGGWH